MRKAFRYTWIVIRNLLMIGVVLLAISKTRNSVQTITVALLLLVYTQFLLSHTIAVRMGLQIAGAFANELVRLRKLPKKSSPEIEEDEIDEEDEIEEESPHAILEMLESTKTEYYINTFATSIVYLIALGALVLSLL